ncbi:TPA: RNA demethylase alkbh5 [Trebouxia sp. C0004]
MSADAPEGLAGWKASLYLEILACCVQVVSAVRPAASSLSSQPTCLVPITHAVTPAPPDSFPQQHSHQQQSHSVVPEAAQSSPQLQTPSRDDKQSCPTPSMPHVSSILELPTKSGLARVIQRDSQDKASAVRIVSEAGGSFQEQGREAVADTVMTGAAEVVPQQEAKAPDTIVSEASGIGYQAGCHLASSGRGVDDSSHSQQGQLPSEQGGEPCTQGLLRFEQGQLPTVEHQLPNKQSQLPIDQRQQPPGLSQLPIKQAQVPCEPCCSRTPEASTSLSRATSSLDPLHSDHHLSSPSLTDSGLPDCAHDGRCCEQSHGSKAAAEQVTTPPQSDADCVGAGGRCHQPEAVAGSPDECTDADSSARDDNRAARDSSGTDHRPAGTDSDGLCPVGITTYTEFYSSEELAAIEAGADSIHSKAEAKLLPPECFHVTAGKAGLPKRTKFFFGARYLWTREQMSSVAAARRAHGVRVDVPAPPAWMQAQVEEPLVATGLAPKGFLNSYALNMYHDGSEGIQSHYDDADRFSRPIYSVRLFSDSRLSFGTQLYGYTNGAFCVDMPRGCITVMEQGGYAASGVKHCVRPVDMSGKSAGMIMRQINADALAEAKALHLEQTCDLLQACHLSSDANVMDQKPAHSSGSPVPSRQLGVRLHAGTHTSQSGAGRQTDEAQIRRVMSAMLKQVSPVNAPFIASYTLAAVKEQAFPATDLAQTTFFAYCVAGDYRREQRGARLRQAEARDIERCMERMLSQVAAKERMIDHEVRLVSTLTPSES